MLYIYANIFSYTDTNGYTYNEVCHVGLPTIFLAQGVKTTIWLHIRTGRNSFNLRKRSDDSNVVIQSVVSSLETQCSVLVSSCSSKCTFAMRKRMKTAT